MPWKFDQFKVDLIWIEGITQSLTTDGAQIDLGDGELQLDMLNHEDGGEIDNGERVS